MDSDSATITLWSYGLAALAYAALTIYQLQRRQAGQDDRTTKALTGAAVASGLWGLGGFLAALSASATLRQIHEWLDVILYAAWYIFMLMLLQSAPGRRNSGIRWLSMVGGVIILFGLGCMAMLTGEAPLPQIGRASQLAFLAMPVFALVLLEQLFRNATTDSRWNLKPLGIGLTAAFVFDLYFYSNTLLFSHVDDETYAVRGFVFALVTPLIALTVFRARARALTVALSQNAVFHTTTLVTVGLYLLATSAAGYYVRDWGGSWGGALQLALLFAALVLLMLLAFSGTTRARLRVWVGKNFFRYRYDYREEWLKFTKALSTSDASRPVAQRVIRGLADMVESPAGMLWLRDPATGRFVQSAMWNMPACDATEDAEGPLVRFLRDSGWVINLEEFRHQPGRYRSLVLPSWLVDLPNAWLVVPLVTAVEMIGFVVLATSRTKLDVNWEVNDLLRTAGSQAASYQAQMQTMEALLEARKFDSFNRMSAFVVHDLKNIITQLSLMVRNAERHADNADFQRDMLLTVRHSVDRMRQLMLQLREGAKPASTYGNVKLEAIVRRVQEAKSGQEPALDVDVMESVVTPGQEERIERVIGHLVQNAIDATPSDGRVWITVGRDNGMAMVEVGDTGCGMSAEFLREQLFKPFQTTKHAGMGIGAYESYQYIKELGGNIRVESEENVGTRFRVSLPLIDIRHESKLKQVDLA